MPKTYDWSSFYENLCQYGPELLIGIDDDVREIIAAVAASTDTFWSDGLQERLAEGSAQNDVRAGVLSTLELWRDNVLAALDADFSIALERQSVHIDSASPHITRLVEAAFKTTQQTSDNDKEQDKRT